MFNNLSEKLDKALHVLKGHGRISEINVAETLKEVRRALLDADVNYKIAKEFTNRVKQAYWTNNDYVKIVKTDYCESQDQLDALYSEYMEQGYEGQMVRNDATYDNKRSKNLLKRKEFKTEEFDVIQVLEGKGNWSGYAKRFVLRDKEGKDFGSGVRGQQAQLKELWEMLNTAKGMPNWATCRYFDLTPDGVPRFPVIIDYGYGTRQD
mgnify:CR=1 FL=1